MDFIHATIDALQKIYLKEDVNDAQSFPSKKLLPYLKKLGKVIKPSEFLSGRYPMIILPTGEILSGSHLPIGSEIMGMHQKFVQMALEEMYKDYAKQNKENTIFWPHKATDSTGKPLGSRGINMMALGIGRVNQNHSKDYTEIELPKPVITVQGYAPAMKSGDAQATAQAQTVCDIAFFADISTIFVEVSADTALPIRSREFDKDQLESPDTLVRFITK